jgi:hypothetical protein
MLLVILVGLAMVVGGGKGAAWVVSIITLSVAAMANPGYGQSPSIGSPSWCTTVCE